MLLMCLLEHRQWHSHVLRECGPTLIEFHDTTARVMLAMPNDLVRCGLVERQAERRLVLPHLSRHVVTAAKLIGKAFAVRVQDQATNATERLGSEELDLGIRIIWLHEAGGMHLDPLEVNAFAADCLSHLDAIAGAMLPVGGWQMHEVRAVLRKQRLLGEVGTEATRCKDDRPVLLEVQTALLVHQADACARAVCQQLVGSGLRDDARLVGPLGNLLHHLD
mmetsp:Transcript_91627/g.237451  ORF Transcript_91627/g.237451 Transcript_91627/m.237451 type:complete len:221 (+) Transcript_91627:204-866(+)